MLGIAGSFNSAGLCGWLDNCGAGLILGTDVGLGYLSGQGGFRNERLSESIRLPLIQTQDLKA
ncbi:MAG: hypothetical protein AAGF94_10235 [Pseudomonadota bacterium]